MPKNKCEDEFCIYWEKGLCILDEVWHDDIGVCKSGIHVEIEKELLRQKRSALLKKFEEKDEESKKEK